MALGLNRSTFRSGANMREGEYGGLQPQITPVISRGCLHTQLFLGKRINWLEMKVMSVGITSR